MNEHWSLSFSHVHKKAVAPQEIYANDGKAHRQGTPPIVTVKGRSPQQGIRRPSAAVRVGPTGVSEDSQGILEKAELVSTR
jgi:hypothetical protein